MSSGLSMGQSPYTTWGNKIRRSLGYPIDLVLASQNAFIFMLHENKITKFWKKVTIGAEYYRSKNTLAEISKTVATWARCWRIRSGAASESRWASGIRGNLEGHAHWENVGQANRLPASNSVASSWTCLKPSNPLLTRCDADPAMLCSRSLEGSIPFQILHPVFVAAKWETATCQTFSTWV